MLSEPTKIYKLSAWVMLEPVLGIHFLSFFWLRSNFWACLTDQCAISSSCLSKHYTINLDGRTLHSRSDGRHSNHATFSKSIDVISIRQVCSNQSALLISVSVFLVRVFTTLRLYNCLSTVNSIFYLQIKYLALPDNCTAQLNIRTYKICTFTLNLVLYTLLLPQSS